MEGDHQPLGLSGRLGEVANKGQWTVRGLHSN